MIVRRSVPSLVVSVALAAGLGLGAAGCAEEADTLDRAATQRAVEKVIDARLDVDVDRVTCPADIPLGTGREVACRASLEGVDDDLRLTVTQRGDEGELDVELLDAVVDPTDVAEDLHGQLVAEFARSFLADCGDGGPQVVEPGETIECVARDAGSRRTVTVTVVDAAGTLRYELG